MRLLLDQNLAPRVGRELREVYPDIRHLREVGLAGAEERGYAIVSKDSDFWHRSVLFGSPPKVIWVRVGNGKTATILELLRGEAEGRRGFWCRVGRRGVGIYCAYADYGL